MNIPNSEETMAKEKIVELLLGSTRFSVRYAICGEGDSAVVKVLLANVSEAWEGEGSVLDIRPKAWQPPHDLVEEVIKPAFREDQGTQSLSRVDLNMDPLSPSITFIHKSVLEIQTNPILLRRASTSYALYEMLGQSIDESRKLQSWNTELSAETADLRIALSEAKESITKMGEELKTIHRQLMDKFVLILNTKKDKNRRLHDEVEDAKRQIKELEQQLKSAEDKVFNAEDGGEDYEENGNNEEDNDEDQQTDKETDSDKEMDSGEASSLVASQKNKGSTSRPSSQVAVSSSATGRPPSSAVGAVSSQSGKRLNASSSSAPTNALAGLLDDDEEQEEAEKKPPERFVRRRIPRPNLSQQALDTTMTTTSTPPSTPTVARTSNTRGSTGRRSKRQNDSVDMNQENIDGLI
mmetsp:Transcript_39675/g.64356  ORF Transcript_39675/g.64356 Transcript_39675/m.64356 type:complete len:409 (-) Transcript_39675:209-1435(-)